MPGEEDLHKSQLRYSQADIQFDTNIDEQIEDWEDEKIGRARVYSRPVRSKIGKQKTGDYDSDSLVTDSDSSDYNHGSGDDDL